MVSHECNLALLSKIGLLHPSFGHSEPSSCLSNHLSSGENLFHCIADESICHGSVRTIRIFFLFLSRQHYGARIIAVTPFFGSNEEGAVLEVACRGMFSDGKN